MAGDHYVQRALIKCWSTRLPNGSWDSEVWNYTFADGLLKKRSAYTLFARVGLNAPEVESRVGKLVDSPLSLFAQADADYRAGIRAEAPRLDRGRIQWRAVALSFLLQTARSLDGLGSTSDSLASITGMDDKKLDAIASRFWSNHRVGTWAAPPNVELLLPETGWFLFPVLSSGGRAAVWGQAIPLNPRTALFAVPAGVTVDPELNSIALFSVGLGDFTSSVVASAAAVRSQGEAQLRDAIRQMRRDAEDIREQVERVRAREAKMFGEVGLGPPVTLPGELK